MFEGIIGNEKIKEELQRTIKKVQYHIVICLLEQKE